MSNAATLRARLHRDDVYANFSSEIHPADLQGWGSYDEIFEQLIRELIPRTIIEVGTWKGASAIHMGRICRSFSIECEIVCVDTWLGSSGAWTCQSSDKDDRYLSLALKNGYPTLYYTFLRNVVDAELQEYITPLPQTSENASQILKAVGAKATIIYIDGAHDYGSVLRDLKAYWPLVVPNGVLLGDDFTRKGVRKAADAFSKAIGLPYELYGRKYVFRKPNP